MYEAFNFTPDCFFSAPLFLSHDWLLDTCMGEIQNYPYFAKGLTVLFKAVQLKVKLKG